MRRYVAAFSTKLVTRWLAGSLIAAAAMAGIYAVAAASAATVAAGFTVEDKTRHARIVGSKGHPPLTAAMLAPQSYYTAAAATVPVKHSVRQGTDSRVHMP